MVSDILDIEINIYQDLINACFLQLEIKLFGAEVGYCNGGACGCLEGNTDDFTLKKNV